MSTLELQAYAADGVLRLALSGELVNGTTARLRTWMQAHVPRTVDRLVLDLSGLQEIDAVGLGALLAAPRRLAVGAQVLLDGAPASVATALRRSGLDLVLVAHVPGQRLGPGRADAPQQVSATAPTMAEQTVETSEALLTNGGMA